MYQVFVRTWWKLNPEWPNGREPAPGEKKLLAQVETIEEAREICREYNATYDSGKLSRKAEFEQC